MTHVALSERCSGITALSYDKIPCCVCVCVGQDRANMGQNRTIVDTTTG